MDPLRLALLSMLIGATISTSPVADTGAPVAPVSEPTAVVEQVAQETLPPIQLGQSQSAATATPVNATPTQRPTARPSTGGGSGASIGSNSAGITRELSQGSSGEEVRKLQQLLKDKGYTVDVDGSFGEKTRDALMAFQRSNDLKADGIAGARTIDKLTSSSAVVGGTSMAPTSAPTATPSTQFTRNLYIGLSGDDVTELQRVLRDLGYYVGTLSGRFDEATDHAVGLFQRHNGLNADGVAGADTLTKLHSGKAVAYPGGSADDPESTAQPTQDTPSGQDQSPDTSGDSKTIENNPGEDGKE